MMITAKIKVIHKFRKIIIIIKLFNDISDIILAAPTKVENLKVEEIAPNTVKLTWEKPQKANGEITHYLVNYIGRKQVCLVYPDDFKFSDRSGHILHKNPTESTRHAFCFSVILKHSEVNKFLFGQDIYMLFTLLLFLANVKVTLELLMPLPTKARKIKWMC